MTAESQLKNDAPNVSGARQWLAAYPRAIPFALFLAIIASTALSVFAIESNARNKEKAQLTEYAQTVASSLERRGTGFSSYLRAGAALFSEYDDVSPRLFGQFVAELRLDVENTGSDGFGWIKIESPEDQRTGDLSQSKAIVTLFAPENVRNRRALGFDMMSDPVRAEALDEARRTVRPTASGRIVIAQEGESKAPGFMIVMPVYKSRSKERELGGFIYAPFNATDFLDAALERGGPSEIGVRLYDSETTSGHLLAQRNIDDSMQERVEQSVMIGNRQMALVVEGAESGVLAPLSMLTLMFGLAVAVLMLMLARLLTQQAFEDQARLQFYQEQNSIRNSLTRELNHRVKNTLANVLSILSLTRRRTDDLDEFADSLQGRIRALSATHDLLTHSDWGTIPMRAVIEAELQHFRSGQDNPVEIDGPDVELAPNDALSFGLALHELGTNAAKFGALSVTSGAVSVRWSLVDNELAEVIWVERGGPAVAESRVRGFGTELIEKIVAHELRNPVELDFRKEGVRCVMRVPIRQTGEFRIRQK